MMCTLKRHIIIGYYGDQFCGALVSKAAKLAHINMPIMMCTLNVHYCAHHYGALFLRRLSAESRKNNHT